MPINYLKKGIKITLKGLDSVVQKVMPGHFPDFIIIGAQKSGTSSLFTYLKNHPNLTASSKKELHYFDRLVHHGYSLDWYKSQFYRKSLKPQLYFESTPKYIYLEDVAKQIAEIKPDTKFILILREPVKRAYSAWNMYKDFFETKRSLNVHKERIPGKENSILKFLCKDRSDFPSFLEAVKIEEKLIEDNREHEPSIIRRGFYTDQMYNYLKYFSRDQILIIGFQELIRDTPKCLFKVYDFLGIKSIPFDKIDNKVVNKRSYNKEITKEEKDYMNEIYKKSNEKLFELLGFKPNW